ncbi:TetR family transcriptional regulator [Streptomyces eurythermus]
MAARAVANGTARRRRCRLRPGPGHRRTRTRARLLSAAFSVFAAKGYGRVAIEEVCAEAGFSRGGRSTRTSRASTRCSGCSTRSRPPCCATASPRPSTRSGPEPRSRVTRPS